MIYSALQPVHSLEGNKKRSAPTYSLTLKPTLPSFILKVPTMVSDMLFRNAELSNNLVENEMHEFLTIGFNHGHSLCPSHEIINSHYNVMIPPSRSWVAIHKIKPPLHEGTRGDNRM